MSELSVDYHAELKRHNYVTPTSYLELIGAFRSLNPNLTPTLTLTLALTLTSHLSP